MPNKLPNGGVFALLLMWIYIGRDDVAHHNHPHFSGCSMLIFLDTEFTDFGAHMDLISIGLAAQDGRTFYGERTDFDRSLCSDFVNQVVLPKIGKDSACSYSESDLSEAVLAWLLPYQNEETVICFDYDGDWTLLTKLLGHNCPSWITALNVYPHIDQLVVERFFMDTGLPDHHALYDAKANLLAFRMSQPAGAGMP